MSMPSTRLQALKSQELSENSSGAKEDTKISVGTQNQ